MQLLDGGVFAQSGGRAGAVNLLGALEPVEQRFRIDGRGPEQTACFLPQSFGRSAIRVLRGHDRAKERC
jgi:hypothetical protein